ncbi:protein kinase domain-containing protein [Nonomuraea sp. ZG12]|uniref:serine/threonine-protein kinase n=1 Tax=Nonomuraea sp. ZG12 TaxID=3452207 RepID=UPI003F8BE2AC
MAADRVLSGPGAEGGAPQSQGRLIGRRYRLMSPVGRGGMGMVWHAHDVLLARDVAVKELILPFGLDHAGKQVAYRRMLREARSAARLTHPGIVTVHDVVEEDGRPWIVMELVRAWSLEQAVRQSGPLPVIQAAEIGIRVLDAVRHAHAAGILHRDIKPGNVLLTSDRVVLTDFGIAAIEGDVTITQTGLLMGSPAYVPPERLSGQPLTQAADLWSFGATLYAAVEGRPPYEGPDAIAVLGAVLTQEPNPPQRAGALGQVIEGLLRKSPADRLTAEQVEELLERVLSAHGAVRPRSKEPPQQPLPPQPDPGPGRGMDTSSGPLPSRIVETPSGPVRVPYDPMTSPSGGYSMPFDGDSTPSGSHRTDQLPPSPRPDRFDAFTSASGSQRMPEDTSGARSASGAHPLPGRAPDEPFVSRGLLDSSSNPQQPLSAPPEPYSSLRGHLPDPDGPSAPPILPLTSDSRSASRPTPWPLASADDLRDHSRGLTRESAHNRLSTLPGVAHRNTTSRRRPEETGNAWVRDGRPTPLLIVTAVASVLTVVAVLMFIASGSGSPAPAPSVASSAPPTAGALRTEPKASPVPDGYREQTPAGFTVGVPPDWKLASSEGEATFSGPKDSGARIVVEDVTPQPDGGLAELSREESDGGVDGYIQVQLQGVRYRAWKAADWEYTYTTENGVPMHALSRYVTIDDSTAYKITFDMPELTWDDQAKTRKVFLDTFRQTT